MNLITSMNLSTIFSFTSMDYLFWRFLKDDEFSYFPWVLWYIWMKRNDKIYRIRIEIQQKILRVAEIEGALWAEVQLWVKDTLPTVLPVINY